MRVFSCVAVALLMACGGGSSGVPGESDVDILVDDSSRRTRFVGQDSNSDQPPEISGPQDTQKTGRPSLQRSPEDMEVEFIADDGTRISGRFQTPGGLSPYPAVLLIHQYGGDRSQWIPQMGKAKSSEPPADTHGSEHSAADGGSTVDAASLGDGSDSADSPDPLDSMDSAEDIVEPSDGGTEDISSQAEGVEEPQVQMETLVSRGFAVLAIDLRGHGASDAYSKGLALLVDPEGAPQDVEAAISWLKSEQAVDPNRIAVVGTSIGGNLAYLAMAQRLVQAGVAISARAQSIASLFGLDDLDGVTFGPVFCIAGELDSSGAQKKTCTDLEAVTEAPNPVKILESSSEHGVTLLHNNPAVWSEILTYLEDALVQP